jgi:uncharacterized lipoprotein YddW (UPF0748 family)
MVLRTLIALGWAASAFAAVEFRGVWIARHSLGSREKIRQTLQDLASANFNAAFINSLVAIAITIPATADAAWMRWRADRLNRFLRDLGRAAKEADWRGLITNAPVVFLFSYANFVQEYPAWVREGSLDFISP